MLESLYLHVPSSPEKEHQDDSPLFITRVPKSPVRNVVTPIISTHEETEKNYEKLSEKEKPNRKADETIAQKEKPSIKATSIMRPRAVLSSPDNDAVIGNKNRIKTEHPTVLRIHNTVPNRHVKAQCKVGPAHISSKSQINTTSSNDAPDNKSDLKGKPKAVPDPRRKIRTWIS